MVDKPPFVDLHSLLNRVTLNFLEEVDSELLSWTSCDVEAVLGKDDNSYKKIKSGTNILKGLLNANLRSGSILAVLIHYLLLSPAKTSLFVSPCLPQYYLQRETKIEPVLRLLKSLFNSIFLQTLIEHCLPLLFCQWVDLKKLTRKTSRTFFWEFGLPVVSHVYVYLIPIRLS